MKKNRLKRILNKDITLMLIPHESSKIHKYSIPFYVLLVFFIITISLFSSAIYIIGRHINYYKVLYNNKQLRKKIDVFSSRISEVENSHKRVSDLEASLTRLLGMKTKQNIIEQSGIGGPTDLSKKFYSEEGIEEFDKTTKYISNYTELVELRFESIERHIGELRSIYRATPKGSPVKGGWITSPFGKRFVPGSPRETEFHRGIDIANRLGAPIYATADGVVSFAGKSGDYGLLIIISHGYGYRTFYGHNSKLLVKKGDRVKRGDNISYMGETGNATGPHVHYEVHKYRAVLNPIKFIR